MKKFVVTGTPRSGTTFLCDRIAKLDNVYMNESSNYEPFIYGSNILDEAKYLYDLEKNHPDKIVGFKAFLGDSFFLQDHMKSYDPIVIIRRDVSKVFLSQLILGKKGADKNFSSKNRKGIESVEFNRRSLQFNAKTLLKWYYYGELIPAKVKLYFEDILEGKTYPELDEYFGNKIDLNTNYQEADLSVYHSDYAPLIKFLRDTAISLGPENFPDYVRENLHI